jgi:DNA-binding Lrp family transcriptional regulator
MGEIDVKDKKILYYLSLDSRQSFTKLGRKVGLSRELVQYRIKRLHEIGIIKNFISIIDTAPFGTIFVRFYYNFQNTTPDIKKKIINYLINHKKTAIIKLIEARYDLEVQYYFSSIPEFRFYIREFKIKFGEFISNEFFSTQLDAILFDFRFLLCKKKIQKRNSIDFEGNLGIDKPNEIEIKLLKTINRDARIPTTEIAEKLNSTPFIITNLIKKLKKKRIIKGYGLDIDFTKLGYDFFHVDIDFKRYKEIYKLIEYVKRNPFLFCIENNIGISDISLQFYLKDSNQLHEILEDISIKIPDSIKSIKYHRVIKEYPRKFIAI